MNNFCLKIIIILMFFKPSFSYGGTVHIENWQMYLYNLTLKNYINSLLKNKKKNEKNKTRGAIAINGEGRLFVEINNKVSQRENEENALKKCKEDYIKSNCQIYYRSFKRNKDFYVARYFPEDNIFIYGDYKFNVDFLFKYGNVIFLLNKFDKVTDDYGCGEIPQSRLIKNIKSSLQKAVSTYPKKFLKLSGLKYVLICNTAFSRRGRAGGLAPMPKWGTKSYGVFVATLDVKNIQRKINYYLRNKENYNLKVENYSFKDYQKFFFKVFSHELYHIIDAERGYIFKDDEWEALNKYPYTNGKVERNYLGKGFISAYAMTNFAEDKAELFEAMVSDREDLKRKIKDDKVLYQKTKLLSKRLKKIYPDIDGKFWMNFDKF